MRQLQKRWWLVVCITSFLFGCAMLESAVPPVPQTSREAYLVAVREADALVLAATDMREMGLMNDAQHSAVLALFDQIADALSIAGIAYQHGDLSTAETQTRVATLLLLEVRSRLTGGDK